MTSPPVTQTIGQAHEPGEDPVDVPVEAPEEDRLTTVEAPADLAIYQGFLVAGAGFEPATFGL
jgi:hypothetical protein